MADSTSSSQPLTAATGHSDSILTICAIWGYVRPEYVQARLEQLGFDDVRPAHMAIFQLVTHRRPKSETRAYLKSLRTMKRRRIAPATYNTALPVWRQAVFRWLRAVVLAALSDCHLARASPER